MFPFDSPKNIKAKSFLMFPGDKKKTLGRKELIWKFIVSPILERERKDLKNKTNIKNNAEGKERSGQVCQPFFSRGRPNFL